MRLRLGTRGSQLAWTQSQQVADALRALGHEVELVRIRSEGDVTAGSLAAAGGLGLFAAALRRALLEGAVEFAVHSLKDLPTAPVEGLVIAAVPPRAPDTDVLCARDGLRLAELPPGARVGTGSPRRAAQLRARRPDLRVVEIRGNVGTRLARASGDLDAVVLARAGLDRLGLTAAITDDLDLLPAPGQGALAVECRAGDQATRAALAALDDPGTRLAVTAERAMLATLEAGCAAPVGARARVVDGRLELTAAVFSVDGSRQVSAGGSVTFGSDRPEEDAGEAVAQLLGRTTAEDLLARGAAAITPLGAARASRLGEFHDDRVLWAPGTVPALVGRHVLLPRADGELAEAIRAAGAVVDAVPLTRTRSFAPPADWAARVAAADWIVLTSPTAVREFAAAGVPFAGLDARIAAVGPATAEAISASGGTVALTPQGRADAESLAAAFGAGAGRVLLPGSALSRPVLAEALRAAGWEVDQVATYTTEPLEAAPDAVRRAWAAGHYDAVLVTAGSVAQAVLDTLGPPPATTRIVAFGRPSARAATDLGLAVAAVAPTQDGPGAIRALAEALKENQ